MYLGFQLVCSSHGIYRQSISSGVRAIAADGGLVSYNAKSKVHNKMLKIS